MEHTKIIINVRQEDAGEPNNDLFWLESPEVQQEVAATDKTNSASPSPFKTCVLNTQGLLTASEIKRSMSCFIPLIHLKERSEQQSSQSLYESITRNRSRRSALIRRKKRMVPDKIDVLMDFNEDFFADEASFDLENMASPGQDSKSVCDICSKSFSSSSGLSRHRRRVHKIRKTLEQSSLESSAKANDDTTTNSPVDCQSEKGRHGFSRSHACQYCQKTFNKRSILEVHERTHTGEKPYLCSSCGTCFKQQISLKEHIKTVHTECRDLTCSICGDSFSRKMSLRYHFALKHSQTRFRCEFQNCGREFVQKAKLQRHEKLHQSSKPHQCKRCNKSFRSIEAMEEHMKKSHEEKSAPKAPRIKKSKPIVIRKPRKTPAPERKLNCKYCQKAFPFLNELLKHEKIHLNIREFKCTDLKCGKAFITKYHMRDHMKKAHGYHPEQPFLTPVTCQYCNKQCLGQGRLDLHVKSKHLNLSASKTKTDESNTDQMMQPDPITSQTGNTTTDLSPMIIDREPETLTESIQDSPIHHDTIDDVIEVATYTFPVVNVNELYTITQPMYNPNEGPGQIYYPSMSNVPQLQFPEPFEYSVGILNAGNGSSDLNIAPQQQYWSVQVVDEFDEVHDSGPSVNINVESEDYSNLANDYSDMIQVGQPFSGNISLTPDSHDQAIQFIVPTEPSQNPTDVQNENEINEPEKRRKRTSRKSTRKPRNALEPHEEKTRKPMQRKPVPPCGDCGKECDSIQHLKQHQKTHSNPQIQMKYTCEICGKELLGLHRLKTHSVMHDPSLRPYKCPIPGCEAEFRGSNAVRKHRREAHPTPVDSQTFHTCKDCNGTFWNAQSLAVHVKIHTEKKFSCPHPGCNYSVVTMARLKRHQEKHIDKDERLRPYKCFLCDKSYLRCENLEQHMDAAHSNIKDPNFSVKFSCPHCPSVFDFDWRLTVHLRRVHAPNKPPSKRNSLLFFTCDTCDWSFSSRKNLNQHVLKTHAKNGIALLCPKELCKKIYYAMDKLVSHVESQHDDMTLAEKELFEKIIFVANEQVEHEKEIEGE